MSSSDPTYRTPVSIIGEEISELPTLYSHINPNGIGELSEYPLKKIGCRIKYKQTSKILAPEISEELLNLRKNLLKIRLKKKMTQGDICYKTRLLRSYISKLENGQVANPSLITLQTVALAMHINLPVLFMKGLPKSLEEKTASQRLPLKISETIRILMDEKDLNRISLGKQIKIHETQISRWIIGHNRPHIQSLISLATSGFNMSFYDFVCKIISVSEMRLAENVTESVLVCPSRL